MDDKRKPAPEALNPAGKQRGAVGMMGKIFGLQQAMSVLFILIGIVWIYIGLTEFGFFDKLAGGTPGFLPIVCAAIMLVAGIMVLIRSIKTGDAEKPALNFLCIVFFVMCGGIVVLSNLIGLLPSLLIFTFIWLKVIEKSSWKSTVVVTLINAAIGYGVFKIALGVPFPSGLLFPMIFNL